MVEEEDAELKLTQSDERQQAYREMHLAIQLRDRLEPAVEAHLTASDSRGINHVSGLAKWQIDQRVIADTLCKESFGAPLVDAVGFAYENYADQFSGNYSLNICFGFCFCVCGVCAWLCRKNFSVCVCV